MPTLSKPVKRFIVTKLACFERPQAVADAVREQFAIEIGRNRVQEYDVNGYRGDLLAAEWKALYATTREQFLTQTSRIAAANLAVRLTRLERMADRAEADGNIELAADLLEQIAKECGKYYTNKRELSGPEGGPLQTRSTFNAAALSDAALDELMAVRHDARAGAE